LPYPMIRPATVRPSQDHGLVNNQDPGKEREGPCQEHAILFTHCEDADLN